MPLAVVSGAQPPLPRRAPEDQNDILVLTEIGRREQHLVAGLQRRHHGGEDDLLRPVHLNARFFGMTPLPTFGAFDVMKNAEVEKDFARFDAHMKNVFSVEVDHVAA